MSVGVIAQAIYEAQPRRIPWDRLPEAVLKKYHQMAEAAVNAFEVDASCPRCVFETAIYDLVDAGEFITVRGSESGNFLTKHEDYLLKIARRWAADDTIQRCMEESE